MALTSAESTPEPGTDVILLAEGYATVTAIRSVTEAPEIELDLSW
jgi:hypothetical protein